MSEEEILSKQREIFSTVPQGLIDILKGKSIKKEQKTVKVLPNKVSFDEKVVPDVLDTQ